MYVCSAAHVNLGHWLDGSLIVGILSRGFLLKIKVQKWRDNNDLEL